MVFRLNMTCTCFQAPLLIGCDVRNISLEVLNILSNEEVISVNQGNFFDTFKTTLW